MEKLYDVMERTIFYEKFKFISSKPRLPKRPTEIINWPFLTILVVPASRSIPSNPCKNGRDSATNRARSTFEPFPTSQRRKCRKSNEREF